MSDTLDCKRCHGVVVVNNYHAKPVFLLPTDIPPILVCSVGFVMTLSFVADADVDADAVAVAASDPVPIVVVVAVAVAVAVSVSVSVSVAVVVVVAVAVVAAVAMPVPVVALIFAEVVTCCLLTAFILRLVTP